MSKLYFSLPGDSKLSLSGAFSTIGLLLFFGISLTLKLNPLGILICLLLFTLAVYLVSRFIKRVRFYDDSVQVEYMFSNKVELSYDTINNVYYNKEGFLPTHVYVIKYKSGAKIKKATFYCSELEFKKVADFLHEKGVRKIRHEQE